MKKIGKISAFALIVMLASFIVKVDAMVMDPSQILDITAVEVDGQRIPTDVYVLGNYAFYNVYTTSDVLMAMNDYMVNTPAEELKPLTLYVLTADPYEVGEAPVAKIENALDAEEEIDEDEVVINLTKIYNLPEPNDVADAANEDEEDGVAEMQKEDGKDVVVFKESYYVRFSYYNEDSEEEEVITLLKDEGSTLTADEIPGNPIDNDNYNFLGWYVYDEELEEPILVDAGLEIKDNIDAYASFEGKSVIVTFHTNGGYFREDYEVTKEEYDAHTANPELDDYDECYAYIYNDEEEYVCYINKEIDTMSQNYNDYYSYIFPYRSGYEFAGWYANQELTELLPDQVEDLSITEVYAAWTPTTAPYYILHRYMDIDGENYVEETDLDYGTTESNTKVVAFERDGFIAPAEIKQQPILGDGSTIVIVVYERETYDVNFEVDGEVIATEKVKYEDYATSPEENPTKDGYAFTGWTLNGAIYDFATPVTEEMTLVAEFNDESHIVSYIVNPDGVDDLDAVIEPKSTKVQNGGLYGETVNVPTNIPDGYAFVGWFLEDGTEITADTMVNLSSNVILYARWNVLTFNIDVVKAGLGDEDAETISIENVSILNFNNRENNVLNKSDIVDYVEALTTTNGLEDIEHFNTEDGVGTVTITNDAVLTITLNYTRKSYKITFEAPSGFADIVINRLYGENYTLEELENANGYTQSFYANNDYSGEAITGDKFTATGNLTYYVKLTPIEYTVSYVFNVKDVNIEAQPKNVNVTQNLEAMLDVPAKVGYTFNGWFTDENYNTPYTNWTQISNAVTLYGKFTAKDIIVTLDAVDGTVTPATIDVTFDEKYDFTDVEAERDGYTFSGWYLDAEYENEVTSETVVATETAHTLYAKWTLAD